MDIRCPKCSEPWDIDSLHEAAAEHDCSFDDVREKFYRDGCLAVDSRCNVVPASRQESDTISAVYDLLGGDVDGAASMLEDAEALGLI